MNDQRGTSDLPQQVKERGRTSNILKGVMTLNACWASRQLMRQKCPPGLGNLNSTHAFLTFTDFEVTPFVWALVHVIKSNFNRSNFDMQISCRFSYNIPPCKCDSCHGFVCTSSRLLGFISLFYFFALLSMESLFSLKILPLLT